MASGSDHVRLEIVDAATNTTPASHPPPPNSPPHTLTLPPPPPPHFLTIYSAPPPHPFTLHAPPPLYQLPLPGYPSAPPPEYGQVVCNKSYEAANATGPYQFVASQANPMYQPPLYQLNDDQSQQLVLVDRSALRRGANSQTQQPSFLAHLILSCCVFWCCGWMCGGIAFLVALIAQNSSASGDVTGARRLGHVSLALSVCGLVFGTILTIVFIVCAQK